MGKAVERKTPSSFFIFSQELVYVVKNATQLKTDAMLCGGVLRSLVEN